MKRVKQTTRKNLVAALLGALILILGVQNLMAQGRYYEDDDYYYQDDDSYYEDQYEEDGYWDQDGYFIPVASHNRHAPPVRYNRQPVRHRRHVAHHDKRCRHGWCASNCMHKRYVNKAPRYRQHARMAPRYQNPPRRYYRNKGPRVAANVRIGPLHLRIRH